MAKTVALEDVYQEFGFGETGPEAIRAFLELRLPELEEALPALRGPARRLDLRPQGLPGHRTSTDRLPFHPVKTSYLWTASDPAYAAVNGDDLLPDLAIGRLPAGKPRTRPEVLVDKVVAFETRGTDPRGQGRPRGRQRRPGAEPSRPMPTRWPPPSCRAARCRRSTCATSAPEAPGRRSWAPSTPAPPSLSYVGHGATAVWACENVFNNPDVAALAAQAQQPLLLTLNCLNGFFHFPPLDSLAEALVKAEGKGAIAAFSPSGLSLDERRPRLPPGPARRDRVGPPPPPGRRPPGRPGRLRRHRRLPRAPLHLPPLRRPRDEDQTLDSGHGPIYSLRGGSGRGSGLRGSRSGAVGRVVDERRHHRRGLHQVGGRRRGRRRPCSSGACGCS